MKKNSNFQFPIPNSGFSLIEMTVVIFGFSILMLGTVALISYIFTVNRQQGGLLNDSDQARRLAGQIIVELRNSQTGQDGSYALASSSPQQIIFFANADKDSGIERIRYYLQNGKLWKGVTEYNGSSYDLATEQQSVVQNNMANGNNPVFLYYGDSYDGTASSSPLGQPVNVTQVKFVKINLQIANLSGAKNTNSYNITVGGAVRNLKTNLGS